ncbi:MAG: 16S rRNA (cytosine(967)-C(5))-methyltransferase RsmB [Thermoleophilia bacterium]
MSDGGVSVERLVAFRALRRVSEGAFADRAFAAEARRADLDPRQRAAGMRLTYGATQRRRTLDWLIDDAIDRPDALEAELRDILRLGAYELVWSDRVPVSASVDQAVRLARTLRGAAQRRKARGGLVNAVMRRLSESAPDAVHELEARDDALGLRYSMPDWIVDGLVDSLGTEDAAGVMAAANEPAESALRWNTLRGSRDAVVSEIGVPTHGDPHIPEAIVLEAPFGIEESPLWEQGLAMAQSRASMLPARAVDPKPGEHVLDMCAAPGAKATHLAALARGEARITCVELHPARAKALRELAERMGVDLEVITGDAREVGLDRTFDAVLLDPPCTGLGVLSSRPDARWRRRPEALDGLVTLQSELLARALSVTRSGGRVVYSTCTLLRAENEDVVSATGAALDATLADVHPDLAHPDLPGALRVLPHRHGTDGFFVARLLV